MKTGMEKLAINGGQKAFTGTRGKSQPKIGVEEFFSIAERFGFKPQALARIKRAVTGRDLLGNGPNFAKYACPFPKKTKGEEFEKLARQKFGVKYAMGISSGTGALHSAFVGVGVGPGKEVIAPGLGFAATAMAVCMAGGVPVFCDIDESLQIDPTKIEKCITRRTVAIAPTHHWSNVADMTAVMKVAKRHNLKVVEDCAQAPGAKVKGRYVGSIGDVGCYSISCYKIIGGGEGGMVVTSNEKIFDRIRQCAEGGGLWRPDRFAPPRYKGELFPGTNYRLSELESAVDLIQLKKLDGICNRYRKVSRRIRKQLRKFKEITPQKINDPEGYIGYQLRFFPETQELSAKIASALSAEGIYAHTRGKGMRPDWHLYCYMYPIILKEGQAPGGSVFDDARYKGKVNYKNACPVAEDLYRREVAVGFDQWWMEEDCDNIAEGINKVLSAFCTEDKNTKAWI